MRSKEQLIKVSVLAAAFLLAVVLGNVSLRYIPVSFAQVSTCSALSFHEMCFHVRAEHQTLSCSVSCAGLARSVRAVVPAVGLC